MPGLLGTFIDRFILVINELPTQHRTSIVGDFNFDQMLPENVAKVDLLIKILTYLSVHNIQFIYVKDYWILYLMPQIPVLFLLYHHPTVITLFLFSKSDHYTYIEFSVKNLSFQSSLHNL